MFDKLEDVPEVIKEFYLEQTISEQQFKDGEPVLVEESFTYLDEDEVEQLGINLVPVFEDNVYVVMQPRPQSVSWQQVESIIELHKGTKDDVVNMFVVLAESTDKWAFHDNYIAWLKACAEVDLYNATEQLDDEGEVTQFEPRTYTDAPVMPDSSIKVKQCQVVGAKYKRDTGRYSPITVDGLTFDADVKAYENIKGSVDNWEILINDTGLLAIGLVDGSQMLWTLEDNSQDWVTKELLQKVLGAVSVRAGLLQAQYTGVKIA